MAFMQEPDGREPLQFSHPHGARESKPGVSVTALDAAGAGAEDEHGGYQVKRGERREGAGVKRGPQLAADNAAEGKAREQR
jgi:hypothetical protein